MPHSLLVVALVAGTAHAAPALRDGPSSASLQRAQLAWERGPDALARWRDVHLPGVDEDGLQLTVELEDGVHPDELLGCIDELLPTAWAEHWVEPGWVERGQVQLWVPWDGLRDLEDCPGVAAIREPHRARPREAFTQGYDAMFLTDWHADGVSGRGVDVAIVDVGYAGYTDLLGRELPSSVGTWEPSGAGPSPLEASTHGTAVAEIVHDLAPGAGLDLYAFSTETEFLSAVQTIAESKVQLVNGSVGFDNIWHADATSPVTQAVDILVGDFDKTWVAAAGNENHRYRIGELTPVGDGTVAIDGMSPIWIATSGGWAAVSLRWSEPMGEAAVDLDLVVYDEDGEPCDAQGYGLDTQDGDDHPYELVSCHTGGSWAQATIVSNGHAVSGLEGYLYAYYGLDEADATWERNLTLPGDTQHGVSVGAVDLVSPDEVADYSSRGPTEYGQRRPHLVAPAGVTTSSYGASLFSGTSSATPHVTGVAALVLHAGRRDMSPYDLREWLTSNTRDIGPEGLDNESGAGFLSPDVIPWSGCHCSQSGDRGGLAWATLGLLGLVALRRRRVSG